MKKVIAIGLVAMLLLTACSSAVSDNIEQVDIELTTIQTTTESVTTTTEPTTTEQATTTEVEETTTTVEETTTTATETEPVTTTEAPVTTTEAVTTTTEATTIEETVATTTVIETTVTEAVTEETTVEEATTVATTTTAKTTTVKKRSTPSTNSFHTGGSELLTDGRISYYTGLEVISHPYSYYQLTTKQQYIYDKLVAAMLDLEEMIEFDESENISVDDVYDVYQLIYNDEYRLYYIDPTVTYATWFNGNMAAIKFEYTATISEINSMNSKLENAMDKILSQLNSTMNDYEIVKVIHDSIITTCTYAESDNTNDVYGTLVLGNAHCQGYSKAFTYLCSEAGINTTYVLGYTATAHEWNLVKVEGDWYHIDCTFDDPDRNDGDILYDYFLITDKTMNECRIVDEYTYTMPTANGTKYQYFTYNNLVADSLESAKELITTEVLKAAETKSHVVQFQLTSKEVYEEVKSTLLSSTSNNLITLLNDILPYAANSYKTSVISHSSNASTYTVKFYLEYD